jgi:parallel beta-helix repeat protein
MIGIVSEHDHVYGNMVSRYYYGVAMSAFDTVPILRHNTLIDNSIGAWCYQCGAYIENNIISGGAGGLYLQSSPSPYVANNTISLSLPYYGGIDVYGGNPEIVNNSISGATWGIRVIGGAPEIHGNNRLENNSEYGLYVAGTLPFNVTDNNTFKNNGVGGIYLGTDSNVRIGEDNVIAYNSQYGIKIQGGNATISNRNIIHRNQYGIYMDTTYAPWIKDNNTIHNNTNIGIWVSASTNPVIRWNIIENNANYGVYKGAGSYFDCKCNWWKSDLGPNDSSDDRPTGYYNPNPSGEPVSDRVDYVNWWRKSTGLCDGTPP